MNISRSYLINEKGDRVGVVLSNKEYERILQALEELESIKAYDAAKKSGDQVVPFVQAIQEIETQRKTSRQKK